MTARAGKIEPESHEYREGPYTVCQMADNFWSIFLNGSSIGHAYRTLREARAFCRWAERNDVHPTTTQGSNQP